MTYPLHHLCGLAPPQCPGWDLSICLSAQRCHDLIGWNQVNHRHTDMCEIKTRGDLCILISHFVTTWTHCCRGCKHGDTEERVAVVKYLSGNQSLVHSSLMSYWFTSHMTKEIISDIIIADTQLSSTPAQHLQHHTPGETRVVNHSSFTREAPGEGRELPLN